MNISPTDIRADITAALEQDGWVSRWRNHPGAMKDEFGNAVTFTVGSETVSVEFEYAIPGIVETMHLDPQHGAARVAAVISMLAAAPRD